MRYVIKSMSRLCSVLSHKKMFGVFVIVIVFLSFLYHMYVSERTFVLFLLNHHNYLQYSQTFWMYDHEKQTYQNTVPNVRINTVMGVTLVRNKSPFLKEWLDFHFAQGFGKFFIYNHNSTDANTVKVLQPYLKNKRVIMFDALRTFPKECSYDDEQRVTHWYSKCQTYCFTQIFDFIHHKFEKSSNVWLLNFDIDEFVFGLDSKCIVNTLRAVSSSVDVVTILGLSYGHSNFKNNSQFDSVVSSHLWRSPTNHVMRKTFVRASSNQIYFITTHMAFCYTFHCKEKRFEAINSDIRFNHYSILSEEEARIKASNNHNSYYTEILGDPSALNSLSSIFDDTFTIKAKSCLSNKF